MWILQNTDTGKFFVEFAEHISIDSNDISEAADFYKASDAHLLMAHLHGRYEVIPKTQIIKPKSINHEQK